MRRLRITTIFLVVGMLTIGGLAYASSQFKQTVDIKLTAKKAGQSTGFKASLESSDPGALQPQGLSTLKVTFPPNTKFNFKSNTLKQCKASDPEIKATGGHACPEKSKIGSGSATANGAPVFKVIPENAVAYAGSNDLIILLSPTGPAGSVLVLHGKISGNNLSVTVPALHVGGLNIVLTQLKLSVSAKGSGKQIFVTAGKCQKGKFVVVSRFVYQTGAKLTLSSSSKCSK